MNGSRLRYASDRDSRCLESTHPKDKPARHTKPGALIIQSEEGCLWQINVLYNSARCSFSCGEDKQKRMLSITMSFIPSNEQTSSKTKRQSGVRERKSSICVKSTLPAERQKHITRSLNKSECFAVVIYGELRGCKQSYL